MVSCPLPRFPDLWPLIPGSSSPLSRVKSLVLWVPTWQLDFCDFWDPLQATGSLSSCLTLPLELPPPCSSPLPPRTGSVVIPLAHIVLSALSLCLDWSTIPALSSQCPVNKLQLSAHLHLGPISCRPLTSCIVMDCQWFCDVSCWCLSPAEEVLEGSPYRKACSTDLHRLQHARVTQLIQNHICIKLISVLEEDRRRCPSALSPILHQTEWTKTQYSRVVLLHHYKLTWNIVHNNTSDFWRFSIGSIYYSFLISTFWWCILWASCFKENWVTFYLMPLCIMHYKRV